MRDAFRTLCHVLNATFWFRVRIDMEPHSKEMSWVPRSLPNISSKLIARLIIWLCLSFWGLRKWWFSLWCPFKANQAWGTFSKRRAAYWDCALMALGLQRSPVGTLLEAQKEGFPSEINQGTGMVSQEKAARTAQELLLSMSNSKKMSQKTVVRGYWSVFFFFGGQQNRVSF